MSAELDAKVRLGWQHLSEDQRLILRDCFSVLKVTGHSLSSVEQDLGDVLMGIRRSEMAPIRKELDALTDELGAMRERLVELRGKLQVFSKIPR